MTKDEAREAYVEALANEDMDLDVLESVFIAVYEREPDEDDFDAGLWALVCNYFEDDPEAQVIEIRYGFADGEYIVRGVPEGEYEDDGHLWAQKTSRAARSIADRRARELRKLGHAVTVTEIS